MYPSFEEFKELAKEYERITVYKEMNGDMDTPVSLLSKFLRFDTAILLESAQQNKTYSRFSFLAFDIKEKLLVREDGLYRNGRFRGPLSQFSTSLARRVPTVGEFGDFTGGYVGYLNFEFVGACGILRSPLSRAGSVLGMLYLIEKFCVYDNYTNKIYLAVSEDVRGPSTRRRIQRYRGRTGPDRAGDRRARDIHTSQNRAGPYAGHPQRALRRKGQKGERDDRGGRGHTDRAVRLPRGRPSSSPSSSTET